MKSFLIIFLVLVSASFAGLNNPPTGGGGGSGLTNFASNVPWLTGSGSTLAATISTNANKIPINVNTDNNAFGLTNFPSTVVLTTRAISTTAPIVGGGDLSADRTFAFDGSQTFNASGATNLTYGAQVVQTNNAVFVNSITNVVSGTNSLVTVANRIATIHSTPDLRHVGVTIDGGGSAITTGVKGDIVIPCNGVLKGWTILNDQSGSITFDVWSNAVTAAAAPTVAGTITAAAKPSTSPAVRAQSFTLTGWGVNVTTNMALRFNVDSATTVTRSTLDLIIERNQP